jgi:hypothetical protein
MSAASTVEAMRQSRNSVAEVSLTRNITRHAIEIRCIAAEAVATQIGVDGLSAGYETRF